MYYNASSVCTGTLLLGTYLTTLYSSIQCTKRTKYTSRHQETLGKCHTPYLTIHTYTYRVCNQSNTTVSLVEQELLTLPKHLSSSPVFSGVRVARSLVFCVEFCRSLFVLFSIALSVLLRFTDSEYPFGILMFFLSLLKQRMPRSFKRKAHLTATHKER